MSIGVEFLLFIIIVVTSLILICLMAVVICKNRQGNKFKWVRTVASWFMLSSIANLFV